jgi:D-alanine-D-alanine ligase-like ATP-grasp enzyme
VAVVEFIIDSRGDVWVLEIDTAPHLHPYAYIPQALESAGISISHFCKDVVQKIHTL